MTAPFRPQRDRKPWLARDVVVSRAWYLGMMCWLGYFAFGSILPATLRGLLILGFVSFFVIDIWHEAPRVVRSFRRLPLWLKDVLVVVSILGFAVGWIIR